MKLRYATCCILLVIATAAHADPLRLIFLHHSTGRNIITEGALRSYLTANAPDLRLWDHDYNYIGLSNASGTLVGRSYNIPSDNTYPDGLDALFNGSSAALDSLLSYDVVIVKSCYPTCDIDSTSELDALKQHYRNIINAMAAMPNCFVLCSPPPRHRLATTAGNAVRCDALNDWLRGYPLPAGVVFFDLHGLLTNDSGFLRYEYERSHTDSDSHPNALANSIVAPLLADAIIGLYGATGVDEGRHDFVRWGYIKSLWSE